MVLDAVSNFVRGETDAAIDSTQTTVSVVDASIFPDPSTDGEYNVVIWDVNSHPRPDQDPDVEILRVTAVDTTNNDLTVTRGQESTSGASHPSGSAVHLSPTAKMFGDIESTFGDFWDATNQELTANVNNTQVITGSVTIDSAGPITEIGVVDHGNVGSDSQSDITVSFSESYSSPPAVMHALGSTEGIDHLSSVIAKQITTSDFVSQAFNDSTATTAFDKCVYIVLQD